MPRQGQKITGTAPVGITSEPRDKSNLSGHCKLHEDRINQTLDKRGKVNSSQYEW